MSSKYEDKQVKKKAKEVEVKYVLQTPILGKKDKGSSWLPLEGS